MTWVVVDVILRTPQPELEIRNSERDYYITIYK